MELIDLIDQYRSGRRPLYFLQPGGKAEPAILLHAPVCQDGPLKNHVLIRRGKMDYIVPLSLLTFKGKPTVEKLHWWNILKKIRYLHERVGKAKCLARNALGHSQVLKAELRELRRTVARLEKQNESKNTQ